ncbi:peptidoglycan-binding domain-containing protein [Nocardiopsis alba]|uniref:Peptidoglycan-binding domain-containing protein n=1 Tax=Nocardiopsis alba TaxID=53437 RepID=A0ABV5DYW3_9ACTN
MSSPVSRSAWGARSPRGRTTVAWSRRTGFTVHYSAGPASQTPRRIQDFHMDGNGWADIGYNFLVDRSGTVYEGRGWTVAGAHAAPHNTSHIGVCFIGRDGDATPAAKASIRSLYDEACRRSGRTLARTWHGGLSGNSTECPGADLRAWVRAGMPVGDGGGGGGAPAPSPGAGTLPGPRFDFPLPAGHYFGPASGPDQSVSGAFRRTFRGRTDREWLREWATQLGRRGWSVGRGRTHLARHGNDGVYGPEYRALARAFQRSQGLTVDGLIGRETWDEAFHAPVT